MLINGQNFQNLPLATPFVIVTHKRVEPGMTTRLQSKIHNENGRIV